MKNVVKPDINKKHKGLSFLSKIKKDPLNFFVNFSEAQGSHCLYEILGKKVLLINDAASIKHVFQDNFENYTKGKFNDVLKPMLGQGIFLTEGSLWKKQRRESAPAFSGRCMRDMSSQMIAASEAMMQRWDQKIENGELIDVNIETMWYTLDVVLRALFHEERDGVAKNVKDSLGVLLKDAEQRIWSMANLPQGVAMKLPKYKKAIGFLRELTDDLVAERKKNQKYPDDLLSMLIASYKGDPNGQEFLRDQVMSFLLAGHETTANALAWTWFELAQRPEIQKRMYHEIDQILGNQTPDIGMLENLKYSSYVFDEVLRLYPPVWTMSRQAVAPDQIPLDDGTLIGIEKGTTVMLCAYSVHRRDTYWPNPAAFDPYRFTDENVKNRPKYAYFPFGGGPRLCLGHKFAKIESLIAISMIAQRYELSLVPGQNISPEPIITLRPDKPVLFKVKRRKQFQSNTATEQLAEAA